MNNKTCIIILNYNNASDTIECIESVLACAEQNDIVVVVDNASTDDSVRVINHYLSAESLSVTVEKDSCKFSIKQRELHFIISGENNGYGAGNNIGIKFGLKFKDTKFFWILNNDTKVKTDALHFLKEAYKTEPAIYGSALIEKDTMSQIQALGGMFNPRTGRITLVGRGDDITLYNKTIDVDYPIGASIFLHKDIIKKIGILEEDYFLFYEELDYSLRAKKIGLRCKCAPKSIVWHAEGVTSGSSSNSNFRTLSAEILLAKNLIKLTEKFYPENIFMIRFFIFLRAVKRFLNLQFQKSLALLYLSFKIK